MMPVFLFFPLLLFLVLTSRWQKSHIMILAPSLVDGELGFDSWEAVVRSVERYELKVLH